jgi:hypothetical protein
LYGYEYLETSRYFYLVTMEQLSRFQADLTPSGAISMQGYWCRVAIVEGEPPIVGPLQQGFDRNYSSLDAADQAALAFPGFAELAEQFQTQPFTAFCALLEAIKNYQPVLELPELPEGEP